MSKQPRLTRRRFIQAAAASSAWALGAASYNRVLGANGTLNVSFIGTSGIAAGQHIPPLAELGANCLCYCDADRNRFGPAFNRWPDATGYTDYREMYDKQHKDIDAVMVGTPDHHHYPATILAMMLGKHTYTQKPLTHTMWEARQLGIAAERYKVATQMGNQMHANEGNRRIVEWVRSGRLGTIKEAHIWTNRPIWPQGEGRPEGDKQPPANLDWEAWIGPAPMRPYTADDRGRGPYHPFNWRGFIDFGTGALGDMGCHTTDGFYWGMNPGFPTAVELIDGSPVAGKDMWGKQAAVKFEFAEKLSRPAFNYYWYEGGLKPKKPDFVTAEGDLPNSGGFIIGELGAIQYLDDYANEIRIYLFEDGKTLEAKFDNPNEPGDKAEMEALVPATLNRSEGHHKEWYEACIGNKPYYYPRSGFRYAAQLTESVLLGTIAEKVGGRLEYDAHNQKITNNDAANQYITKQYREGWEFKMD